MLKRFLIILMVVVMLPRTSVKADEGMWLPFLLNDALFEEMQSLGFNMTREQLFSFSESSLKDAIVSIGGCTAEIISGQGLMLTNHHCGKGRIQAHSSVGNDLLRDGFWAASLADELPNPGMVARFLVNVEDVTEQVAAVLRADMTEAQRNMAIRTISAELEKKAVEGTHYTATLRPMFAGNEFFIFVFETFTDVRLVGAPPSSIGEYGGDTDNWMWPRHTGDFTLFRVYSGPDGKPADYSTENIPLKPRHHLPVSVKGVKEGDFAMVMGYPGSTQRYLTSHGIEFNLDKMYPPRIEIRRRKLDIIEAAMAESDQNRIMYASRQSGVSNYWKNFIGMSRALVKHDVAGTKRQQEAAFMQWVNADRSRMVEYGDLMQEYQNIYDGMRQFNSHNFIYMEAMASGPSNLSLAGAFSNLPELLEDKNKREEAQEMINRLRAGAERTFRNYNPQVEEQLWAAMFEEYFNRIPRQNLPEVFQTIERRYRNDFNRYAADVFKNSIFASAEKLNRFLDKPSAKVLKNDPMFVAATSVNQNFQEVNRGLQEYGSRLARAERMYIKGLRQMDPEGMFYPDANSTMRLTYGTVSGYYPADAVYYNYQTTMSGVIEKEDPNNHEFFLDEKLKKLYQNKDFGQYAEDGVMYVNFLSNNDITGGNSGSPVINGDGHLIGLAFDGNWEAMSGDILFENETQRTISVDARYILFVIEKFAGARHLIDEMTIVR
jgi:hypothetical protein